MLHRPRYFSTAAKVHPRYLPQMHPRPRRMPFTRWLKSIAALLVVGYGIRTYAVNTRDRRIAEAQVAQQRDAERRRQNEALMDEYGDRSSLEELEKAVRFYERKS